MTAEVKKRRFAEGVQVTSPTDLSAGGSGSGEKNYILNASDSTNWGESTDGQVDVTTTTTLSELPREFTTESGIKIVGTGSTGTNEYVYYRFSLDDADKNRKLKIAFAQKSIASYVDGELTVEVHYNAQSDYLGAYTQLTVPNSDINTGDGDALYTFDTDSTGIYYELRINKPLAATTTGVVISDVVLGPGKVIPGAAVSDWESYTPSNTQGFGTIASDNIEFARVGGSLYIRGYFTTGTPTASEAQLGLPPGLTIGSIGSDTSVVGTFVRDISITDRNYIVMATNGDSFVNFGLIRGDGVSTVPLDPQLGSGIVGTGERDSFEAGPIPIAEWANSTVNFINDEVAAQNAKLLVNTPTTVASATGAGTFTDLDFSVVELNDQFSYTPGTGVGIIPADGDYEFNVVLQLAVGQVDRRSRSFVNVNSGTRYDLAIHAYPSLASTYFWGGTRTIPLVKGDTFKFEFNVQDSVSGAYGWIANTANFASVTRVPDYTAGQAVSFGAVSGNNAGLFPAFKPWQDLSFSGTPAGWSVVTAKGMAQKDPSGVWSVTVNIWATATSFTTATVTLEGVDPLSAFNALYAGVNSGVTQADATITSAGLIRISKTASTTGFLVSGTFVCSAEPTFV